MTDKQRGEQSLLERFDTLVDQHRPRALATLGVLAILSLLAAQVVPGLQDILLDEGVFTLVTLLVVVDLAREVALRRGERSLVPVVNQDDSMPVLIAAIPECRREKIQLLEYAAATTLPLIRAIEREGATLQLLMKHPETVEGLQRQRMLTTLDTLYTSVFDDYKGQFEARCYRQPYSLRGRRLGNRMLEVGWLTPDYKRHTAYGHANPSLIFKTLNGSSKHWFDFFDKTFKELWDAPDTEDAAAVLARLSSTT